MIKLLCIYAISISIYYFLRLTIIIDNYSYAKVIAKKFEISDFIINLKFTFTL